MSEASNAAPIGAPGTGYIFLVSFRDLPGLNLIASHPYGWSGFAAAARANGSTADLGHSVLEFEYLMDGADQFYARFAQCEKCEAVNGAPGYYLGDSDKIIAHLMQHIVGEDGGTIRPIPDDPRIASFQALCDFVPFTCLTRHIADHVCQKVAPSTPVELIDQAITEALVSPEKVASFPVGGENRNNALH